MVLPNVGETTKTPYRRLRSLRFVSLALLLMALVSNSYGQLALGYSLLAFGVTALIIWSFAELMIRARE